MKELYQKITKWQDEVFVHATPISCTHHLIEEVEELKMVVSAQNEEFIKEEIADCFLLLFGVCNKSGMTFDDILKVIENKMEINYKRNWGEVNEKGYVKHSIPTGERKERE